MPGIQLGALLPNSQAPADAWQVSRGSATISMISESSYQLALEGLGIIAAEVPH